MDLAVVLRVVLSFVRKKIPIAQHYCVSKERTEITSLVHSTAISSSIKNDITLLLFTKLYSYCESVNANRDEMTQ